MRLKLIFRLLACACILSACQRSAPGIPANADLVILAWREGWLGSASGDIIITSSDGSGEIFYIDLPKLGAYPEWSPDGQWILSIRDEHQQIWIINTTSGETRKVIEAPDGRKYYDASWSPDSGKIVYTILVHWAMDIRWVDVSCMQNGGTCKPEEHVLHYGLEPDWSPDGRFIAFAWDPNTNFQAQGEDSIFVMNLDSSGQSRKISGDLEDCGDPDWSPDGTRLVFSCREDIYISNADGSGLANLTPWLPDEPADPWYPDDVEPSWDPNSGRIAFLSQRDTFGIYVGYSDWLRTNALYTMDPDGQNIERITLDNRIAIVWYAWVIRP
jgi:Tol biopolymer transport system component